MVYRIYVEKKEELANEAKALYSELKNLVGMLHRYRADSRFLGKASLRRELAAERIDSVYDIVPYLTVQLEVYGTFFHVNYVLHLAI